MTDGRSNKITRDHQRSLMDELIERMLPVRTWFPPNYRTRMPANRLSIPVHTLPVAFHIPLLEIGRKPVHILVIRKDRLGLRSKEIRIPQPDQRHRHRDILLKFRRPEM